MRLCQHASKFDRGLLSAQRKPNANSRKEGSAASQRTGVFATTFSQISISLLCVLVAVTLTSPNAQAGIWDSEQEMSTDIVPEWQRHPSVDVSGDKVHVLWEDNGDGDIDIYYRLFNGTDWETEMEISTDVGTEIQLSPSIAVEGNEVYAVWESRRSGDSDIFFKHFNGTAWEAELELSSDSGTENQWSPSVAADGGKVYVVWEDMEDGDLDVYFRLFNGTAWEAEEEISTDTGNENQRNPCVAAENGNVYVVWGDEEDGDYDIYYRYFDGTNWHPEQEISTDMGDEAQWNPSIAAEGGKAYVVWENNEGFDYDIYYRHFNGTIWAPVSEISSDVGEEAQRYPSIAVGSGEAHVVWMDVGDGDVDIYYRRFNGTNWLPEQEISTDVGTEYQWDPSIAVDGINVQVVWHDPGEGDDDIYYRRFDGTNWLPEKEISTDKPPEEQSNPAIAVYGTRIHTVWQDPEDGDYDIYYRLFNGIVWQTEQEISTDVGSESQENPSIAVDALRVCVVWEDYEDGDADIYYRLINGTAWEPEVELSSDSGSESQLNPSIAAQDGKVHVVWEDYEDGDADIYYRLLNGTAWEPEQEISSDVGSENQSNSSIAAGNGLVHIAWADERDGDTDIYYRRFNGTAWEPEQEISSDVGSENQSNPSIAAMNGIVHVVWEDQGGGDADIYYRHFNGTAWEPEQEISSDIGSEWQVQPSISVEDTKVYVVWSDGGSGDEDILFRRYNGSGWETEFELSSDDKTEKQGYPSIGVAGGNAHVVWQDWGDGDSDIYYRRGRIEDYTSPDSYASPIEPYWQTTPAFNVDWTATDDHNLANISLYYRYSLDNSSWSEWKDWAYNDSIMGSSANGAFPFGAAYGDAFYEFATVASDTSWNTEVGPTSADAICGVDTVPPTGSIIIDNDDTWSTSASVTLFLTYSDLMSGVYQVRFSNDGVWDIEPWESPSTSKPWALTPGDGTKTVYYQIRDRAGWESATYSDSIQLDTTAPRVETITPADNASGVKITTDIQITFSERMVETSVEDFFGVTSEDTEVEGSLRWSADSRTLTFAPTENLTHGTTYRVRIINGQDNAGNILETPFESSFTTEKVTGQPDALDQYWLVALLIVIVVMVVALILTLHRRRKVQRAGEEIPAEEETDSESVRDQELGP